MVFTAKKVEEVPGFSEKLKKAREEAGLSKEKVCQMTGFQLRHLEELESSDFEKMPADVYSKGFLRKYAKILDIDPDILVLEYEKEIKIVRHLNKKNSEHQSLPVLSQARFVITPKTLGLAVGAVIFLFIAGYLGYQLHFLISPPSLSISEPVSDVITQSLVITVRGETEPTAKLLINGQIAYLEKDGSFSQEVTLNQGLNIIKVEAINRFEKKNSIVRQVVLQ